MSGAMRKMGVYLGLVEDDPYGEYGDPAPERAVDDRYADASPRRYDRGYAEAAAAYEAAHDQSGYVDRQPARAPRLTSDLAADPLDDTYRITTLHPRTYNEARTIGEHFRAGTPVIMILTEVDDADAMIAGMSLQSMTPDSIHLARMAMTPATPRKVVRHETTELIARFI